MLKRILILAGALLMAAGVSLAHAGDAAPTLTRLENGLGVLVQPDKRFPLVSLRLYVHAGSAYETPGRSGISHLLEHMVFKGTARRAPGQVAEDIESAGGYLNAATSFDYTVYIYRPARRAAGPGPGRAARHDLRRGPGPRRTGTRKASGALGARTREDSPGSRRFQALQPLLWPGTPYERPIIGLRETSPPSPAQDILDYIAEFYQPQSMLAVVVGDVDPARAVDMVPRPFRRPEEHRADGSARAAARPAFRRPRAWPCRPGRGTRSTSR
jgi:zinc protease